MNRSREEGVDLDAAQGPSVWGALSRNLGAWIAITAVGAILGALLTLTLPTTHARGITLILRDPREVPFRETGALPGDFDRSLEQAAEFARSPDVIDPAAEGLGIDATTLRRSVRAAPTANGVRIQVEADTRADAREWSDAVVAWFRVARASATEASLQDEIDALEQTQADVQTQLAELAAQLDANPTSVSTRALYESTLEQLEALRIRQQQVTVNARAFGDGVVTEIPAARVTELGRSPLVGAVAGAIVAGSAGALLLWFIASRRRPLVDPHEPGPLLHAPFLGAFGTAHSREPRVNRLPVPSAIAPCVAVQRAHGKGILAVIGSRPGEGVTHFSLNLAVTCARAGQRTVLVDTGSGQRSTAALLAAAHQLVPYRGTPIRGITTMRSVPLAGSELDIASLSERFSGTNTSVDTGRGLEDLLAELAEEYDSVIIDVDPGEDRGAAPVLAAASGRAVAVVRLGTPAPTVRRLDGELQALGVDLLGYVFNEHPRRGRA
jgi:Mrp family chromosome partitioning ATPase